LIYAIIDHRCSYTEGEIRDVFVEFAVAEENRITKLCIASDEVDEERKDSEAKYSPDYLESSPFRPNS
jgi:hypothetical protein